MSTMRMLVNDKERNIRLKRSWIDQGKMYVEATTGEMFSRSLKYFPTDRYGWQPIKAVTPFPNPAVMSARSYSVYCAAKYVTSPRAKKQDPDKEAQSTLFERCSYSWSSPIVMG